MKVAAKLAIALFAIGLGHKLSAHQTAVIIDLTGQTAYLLESGRVALVSPIASGKDGWETPSGSFTVIEKDLNHQSGSFGLICDSHGRVVNPNSIPGSYVSPGCHYVPAPMPYFMEFSKYVGLHAGYLPGYPASHGCVRMPRELAAEFYARVQIGTPVKVIGNSRNVTRVRRAIPIVQPGYAARSTASSGTGKMPGGLENSSRVKKATTVVQRGRSRYATAFLNSGSGNRTSAESSLRGPTVSSAKFRLETN